MANLDVTKGRAGVQPKGLHVGLNKVLARISLSLTTSAGDVIRFAKLPHGAQVTEVVIIPRTAFAAGILRVGTSISRDAFFSSATFSVLTRNVLGSTFRVSLSDEAIQRYDYATLIPAAALTVGYQMDVVLDYILDDAGEIT